MEVEPTPTGPGRQEEAQGSEGRTFSSLELAAGSEILASRGLQAGGRHVERLGRGGHMRRPSMSLNLRGLRQVCVCGGLSVP